MAAELKTRETGASVHDFLNALENEKQKGQSFELLELFEELSGTKAKMWGDSIVGFGHYPLQYSNGKVIDWMRGGFSPRKGKFSLYVMDRTDDFEDILDRLGKHKTGKSCLYINKLEDIDRGVLRELVHRSFEIMKEKYPQ